jgi:hypothetical protein
MLIPIDQMTKEQFDAVMRVNGMPTTDEYSSSAAEGTNVKTFLRWSRPGRR